MKSRFITFMLLLTVIGYGWGQPRQITLSEAITIASEKSFDAFKNDNLIRKKSYQYMKHLNLFKPTLSLDITPVNYNRSLQQVYDSEEKQMEYVDIHNLSTNAGLRLSQKVKFTGGTLSASSNLNRYQKFGDVNDLDFITTPVNISYSQNIFSVNEYKWQAKTEPLAFEKAKQEYLEQREEIALKTIRYYFSLLSAQTNFEIAQNNRDKAETLLKMGKERYNINSISLDELYQLELRLLKANNSLEEQKNTYELAMLDLLTFLEMDNETRLSCIPPENITVGHVPENEALDFLRNNNPDFLSFKQQSISADYQLAQAKSKRFSANMNLGVGLNNKADEFRYAYTDPTETERARLSVTVPILAWGNVKRNILLAESNVEETKWSIRNQEKQLLNQALGISKNFNIRMAQVENAAKADSLARITYNIVEERYRLGKLGILNLNDAQNEQVVSQRNYITALQNYWTSYYQLRKMCLFDFDEKQDLNDQLNSKIEELSK